MSITSNTPTSIGPASVSPAPMIDTDTILAALADQQQRIVGIVADLDDTTMRCPVLPTGWSCAGMIQHLTGMTSFWFETIMSGGELVADCDEFALAADVSTGELVERYSRVTRRGHDMVRHLPLDTPPEWWPADLFGPWRLNSLFEVLQHVLVESATHAGHLDAARELIDGRTWDYTLGRLADPV